MKHYEVELRDDGRDDEEEGVTKGRQAKIKLYRSARADYPTLCPLWLTVWVFDNCRFRVRERAGKYMDRRETGRKV